MDKKTLLFSFRISNLKYYKSFLIKMLEFEVYGVKEIININYNINDPFLLLLN